MGFLYHKILSDLREKLTSTMGAVFMKNLILILAGIILIFLEGCGTVEIVTQKDYDLVTEKTVTVGSTMLSNVSIKSKIFDSDLLDKGTKEEIVYTGKSGNTLRIDYNQYSIYDGEWYIEDGFPLHLEFDMSLGDLITCKYYRMRILSFDNNDIRFIVIND